MRRVLVLGGDGFCGWPTALHLSEAGHAVAIVDNFVRRRMDQELQVSSLTPIRPLPERLQAWRALTGRTIDFIHLDIAQDYDGLSRLIHDFQPEAIVHFAEQRAAPYSMKSVAHKCYTIDNNVSGTHNVLAAIASSGLDTHLVHLGTMGVYDYDGDGLELPEGYLDVKVPAPDGRLIDRQILYPTNPGSIYHMTKSLDQVMFQFYARNDGVRITDLHQGIVWGSQTTETRRDEALINRFDYDGDFGTVLNRFLIQAAIGHPLTVHGTGGQTRAFINIQDTVACVRAAVESADQAPRNKPRILNQIAETRRVRDLAAMVSRLTGARVDFIDNPRFEAAENELAASNRGLQALGQKPITLVEGLLRESIEIARRYADNCDREKIPARSLWRPQVEAAAAAAAAA